MSTAREMGEEIKAHIVDYVNAIKRDDLGNSMDAASLLLRKIERLVSLAQPGEGALTGWKLVPVEPTVEMLTAGANATELYSHSPRGVWAAMLEAAPPPGITSTPTGDTDGNV